MFKVPGIGSKKVEIFGPRIDRNLTDHKKQMQDVKADASNEEAEVRSNIKADIINSGASRANKDNNASNEMEIKLNKTQLRE